MPLDFRTRIQLSKTDPEAIASILNAGPTPEDSYLYERLGGAYDRYEEMLLDPQIRGKLSERVGALLGRSVLVDTTTTSKADQEAADTARRIIDNNLIPYEQICANFLLSGLIIGFSVQAVVAAEERTVFYPVLNENGETVKTAKQTILAPILEFVPQRRFTFRYHQPERKDVYTVNDEELDPETDIVLVHGYELRLLTRRSPIEGERCSKERFFCYTFGSLKGLPWGYGLGAMIRKFYEIRKEVLISGVLTGDRLGSPPVHGTYSSDLDPADPEQMAVLEAFRRLVRAISPNANAVTSDAFKINFPVPPSGGQQILKWLYELAGVEITRAIWGEGSYSEKETGSYAAEAQQATSRNENFVDSDCNSLDEQLGAQLWHWIAEKNYPKANPPVVRRETFSERRKQSDEAQQEEMRSKKIGTDRTLILDLGLNVTDDYIKETYGDAFSLPNQTPPPEEAIAEDTTTEEEPPPEDVELAEFGANVHHWLDYQGLRIGVRNLPGETRFPQFRSAKKLQSAYGFVQGIKQGGKALRCFVHPSLLEESDRSPTPLYRIAQLSPRTSEIDEYKLMLGYPSIEAAELAYRREMPETYFGGIEQISADALEFAEPEEELDIADAYEERLTQQLRDAYGRSLSSIQEFIERIAQSDGTEEEKYRAFVDGIYNLYEGMDMEAIANVLGDGLAAGYLAGMYSERIDR